MVYLRKRFLGIGSRCIFPCICGRKRIILADYLLQIYLSCLCRYRPPISFTTLQLFIYLWNPKCLTLNPQSLFFGCKFVELHAHFHFAWNVPHIPWSFSAWLTPLSVGPFTVHPCGSQCPNSLISVVICNEWEIIYCICVHFLFKL